MINIIKKYDTRYEIYVVDINFNHSVLYKLYDVNGEPVVKKLEIPEEFRIKFNKNIFIELLIKMLIDKQSYFIFDGAKVVTYSEDQKSSLIKDKLKGENVQFYSLDKLIEIYNFFKE